MFAAVFDPADPGAAIERFMTADYTQYVNGTELDRAGFVEHVAALRAVVAAVRFDFEEVVASEDRIATRHVVHATKRDGTAMSGEVHAFLHLRGDRVERIVELTNMISGAEGDEDLGERR